MSEQGPNFFEAPKPEEQPEKPGQEEQKKEAEKRENENLEKEIIGNPIVSVTELIPNIRREGLRTIEEVQKLDLARPVTPSVFGHHTNDNIYMDEYGSSDQLSSSSPTDYIDMLFADVVLGNDQLECVKGDKGKISTLNEIFKSFENQVVIDLGAGQNSKALRIVELAGVRGYIGVENSVTTASALFESVKQRVANWSANGEARKKQMEKFSGLKKIPVAIVPEDALHFLKRLPENSVMAFFSSGNEVIGDDDYRREMIKELQRVLHQDGTFIEYNGGSDLWWKNEQLGSPLEEKIYRMNRDAVDSYLSVLRKRPPTK